MQTNLGYKYNTSANNDWPETSLYSKIIVSRLTAFTKFYPISNEMKQPKIVNSDISTE